jgi:hypothetical protein
VNKARYPTRLDLVVMVTKNSDTACGTVVTMTHIEVITPWKVIIVDFTSDIIDLCVI